MIFQVLSIRLVFVAVRRVLAGQESQFGYLLATKNLASVTPSYYAPTPQ